MIYSEKTVMLKSGQKAIFRSPKASDVPEMMKYMKTVASETHFVTRYPEECPITPEAEAQELRFLERINDSQTDVMIVCFVDGEIAGNCQLSFRNHIKIKHRASVAIAVISKYWRLGIGTAMFSEMDSVAKENGITQLELDYIEGNERAKALYEKVGFVQVAERPDAIRLKDGTMLKEISMIKKL